MTTFPVAVEIKNDNRIIPAKHLFANDWNPNQLDAFHEAKLVASLRKHGFLRPLTVIDTRDGSFLVLDGEQRLNCGKHAGMKEFPCIVIGTDLTVDEARQKEITLLLNEVHGEHDPEKVRQIVERIMVIAPRDTILLPYSDTQLQIIQRTYDRPEAPIQSLPETRLAGSRRDNPQREQFVSLSFSMYPDAAAIVRRALDRMRETEGEMDDRQALEYICVEYLNTVGEESDHDDE